ncbi:MAG: exonuclease [Lysobacter sp.]|nr:MAG: exonuclease [Lysobacter sp.]
MPVQPVPANARNGVDERIASLRRLLGVRGRAPAAPVPRRGIDRSLPGVEIDHGLWLIESHIADVPPCQPLSLAFARRDDHVETSNLLFFDTETTGLTGGTGTRAFMIGAADWHDGALRIRQLLIANMAAENAMLREFARWLGPSTVLASYNGRSYDAPLLRTRYRLARLPDALHGLDHLDLLHPSRRRWRGRWENCRLATIEREALCILREDDLPGAQAPAAWLAYLRGGASTDLRRVAEHNRQDVATLAQLLLRLCDEQAERR